MISEFDFRAEELNVKVTIIEVHNAKVGILIGQYTDDKNSFRRTYKILHSTIWGPTDFPRRIPNVEFNDLNEKNLDSWTKREHQRERVTWQVKDGRLNIYTKPFCNGRLNIGRILSHETH